MGAFNGGAAGRSFTHGRLHATPRLSRTARAIRLSLALSAAALAMSGSGNAFATTCVPAGAPPPGSTVTCSGAGVLPITYAVENLTVITDATVDLETVTTAGVSITGTTGDETFYNYGVLSNTGIYTVDVSSDDGAVTVENQYGILAYGDTIPASTYAIHANSVDGAVAVDNTLGAYITVYNSFGDGFGIYGYSQTGTVDITNDGSIYVSPSGTAYGIYAASDDGIVHVYNSGDITANSSSDAYGIYAQSYVNAYVDNSGSVLATSTGLNGYATAVFIYTCDCYALDANVDNSGTLSAFTTGNNGNAYGVYIYAYDVNGDAYVGNSGEINATATGAGADATGVYVTLSDGLVDIDTSGTIDAYAFDGVAYGIHAYIDGDGPATVANSGTIEATSMGAFTDATGVYISLVDGMADVDNSGSIEVYSYNGGAYGIHLYIDGDGPADVTNSGTLTVTSYINQAYGVYVAGYGGNGDIHVGNSGVIDVSANQSAEGVHAYSNYDGYVDIDNSGTVTVTSTLSAGTGLFASSFDGDAAVDNSGSIAVTTYGFGGDAIGINAIGDYAATVTNSGTIDVSAEGVAADANGIMIQSSDGPLNVDSSGTILVYANDSAHGIDVFGDDGDVYVSTDGLIDVSGGDGYGIQLGVYGLGDVHVDNDADINAYAAGFGIASGIDVHSYYGYVELYNSGVIDSYSTNGTAYGIRVDSSMGGDITIGNDGAITALGANDVYGIYAYTDGDITLANTAALDVTTYGIADGAYGIWAYTAAGAVSVDNSGAIDVTAFNGSNGFGIYVHADGPYAIDVNNDAAITVTTTGSPGGAIGIYVYDTDGTVSITSAGAITAQAYASATGIMAFVGGAGTLYVSHDDIDATSDYFYGNGVLAGSTGTGGVDVIGTGDVTVSGELGANGIWAYASGGGDVSVNESGSISATTVTGSATGILATSATGNVTVQAGDLYATGEANSHGVRAVAYLDGYVYVTTTGTIDVAASTGSAYGVLAWAQGAGDVDVASTGNVTAVGDLGAFGIRGMSDDASVSVASVGNIVATGDGIGPVAGISAQGYVDVYVGSDGAITANSYGSSTMGIHASTATGDATVQADGSITAYGFLNAYGIEAYVNADGDVDVSNGDITVTSATGLVGCGVCAHANGAGTTSIDSGGNVLVYADNGYATGLLGFSYTGDVLVQSAGGITAEAYYTAYGIHAYTFMGAGYVDVTAGDIDASSVSGNAYGVLAIVNGTGGVSVATSGAVSSDAIAAQAFAILATSDGGNAVVVASGAVTASSYGGAFGIRAETFLDGYVDVSASGLIDVYASSGTANGVYAHTSGAGDVTVSSTGGMDIDGNSNAYGIHALAAGTGSVDVTIAGDVSVYAHFNTPAGVYAHSYGADTHVDVTGGSVYAGSEYGSATGIDAYASTNAYVNNDGGISVYAGYGNGTGILAVADTGYVLVQGTGDITANAYGVAHGVDAQTLADGDVDVTVGGAIVVNAYAGTGYGVLAHTSGAGDVSVDVGDVAVHGTIAAYSVKAYATGAGSVYVASAGDISAAGDYFAAMGIIASAGSGNVVVDVAGGSILADASAGSGYGINAYAGGDVAIDNGAAIQASGYVRATGIFAQAQGDLDVVNHGAIDASVGDYDYGDAFGIRASTAGGDVYIGNDAAISASADGAYAGAIGIAASSGTGAVRVVNSGDIDAASAANATGIFSATDQDIEVVNGGDIQVLAGYVAAGIVATGGQATVSNTGALSVTGSASAQGIAAYADGDLQVYDAGEISATATGADGSAIGVHLSSLTGGIVFYNLGDIHASADYYATGVQLDATGPTLLVNQGTIGAQDLSGNGAAVLTGDGEDLILNFDTIDGVVRTGAGDDTLYNYGSGTWNAAGSSDFGDGDDTITNYGLIAMDDAVIDLGLPGSDGNAFCNYGVITVSGDNIIDMEGGSASTLLASSNPLAFYNYGTIDFRDGSPTDTLAIVGDFGGDGQIYVDVSGLNGTGDLLYIEGDVLSGSSNVNTINIEMLDMPPDGTVEVPVVQVAGNSVAGSFVLGSVDFSPIPFVTTSFSLVSNINTANSAPDQFLVRVAMDADDSGAIAADLPAGVQLLMNDVVGSWRKRVDGMGDRPAGKFSLWARLYHNKGKVDPDFDSDTIDEGEFAFEQKNYGGEAGFDFAPSGKWNFGIMLGRANADQDLRAGLGSDRIEGNVAGGYGTFRMPRGFYFDLSHRRLDFDAVVHTANGNLLASGKAESSNAESGYSFAWKGFEFEGQLQVTHTRLVSLDNLVGDSSYSPPTGSLGKQMADPPPVEFDNDADIATTTRAGWDIRKKYKSESGTLWEWHATMNRIRTVGGQNSFQVTDGIGGETDIGGDSSLLDVGFTARSGLLLIYGGVTWQDGGVLEDFFGAQFGAKYTW